jgi:transcriptional regulator with XRE-family HTH domain
VSPFSSYLQDIRKRFGISQRELASKIGYEQGYISGLELGKKGPPPEEFVEKLIVRLNLNAQDESLLRLAVTESQRRYVLPENASTEEYRLFHELWSEIGNLDPSQIKIMLEVLRLPAQLGRAPHTSHQNHQKLGNMKERHM